MDHITPYAEYNGYQPATIGQLDRLRCWIDRVADRCDDLIAAVETDTANVNAVTDELKAIRATCDDLTSRVTGLDKHGRDVDAAVNAMNTTLITLQDRLDDIQNGGYVAGVDFTPTDDGFAITVNGTKNTTQHRLSVSGDAYSMVRVTHAQTTTDVAVSGKGGLADPARITTRPTTQGAGVEMLAPDGTTIATTHVTSPDGTLKPSNEGTDITLTVGDGLNARLDALDTHISDVDRAHGQRPTLDEVTVDVGAHGYDTDYIWRTINGTKTKEKTIGVDIDTDGTVDASTTAATGGVRLDLSALPVLKRLPLLESKATLNTDDKGLTLGHTVYHPQTGTVSDDGTDHVPVAGDDTLDIDLTDGLHLSAAPTVAKAKAMDDALSDALLLKIKEQTQRIDSLTHTVADMQRDVRTALNVADRSVTNATLTLTGEEDDGATATISLLSRSGVEVARLPVTLRVKSTNGTVKAGVQTNGNVATLAIDVVH
jgi:uncharacterized protein YoxC